MKNTAKILINPIAKAIKKMAVIGANTASVAGIYQPAEPKEMKKFKK